MKLKRKLQIIISINILLLQHKDKNELNELSKKVKAISTNKLAKDLIGKSSILNGAEYFSSGIFQNYLVFIPAKKQIKYFHATTRIYS